MRMKAITVDYLKVSSKTYGRYTLLKLEEVNVKELRRNLALLAALVESFGEHFVVVFDGPDGTHEFVLSEYIVGIPTPELERQLAAGTWQAITMEVEE